MLFALQFGSWERDRDAHADIIFRSENVQDEDTDANADLNIPEILTAHAWEGFHEVVISNKHKLYCFMESVGVLLCV